MTTIIRKTSTTAIQEADSSMPALKETSYEPNSYEAALVSLGEILLREEEMTEWMSTRKVSAQCLKHWKHVPRNDYGVRAFSDWAGNYFSRCGEIRGKGVKVEHRTEPCSHQNRDALFLKFSKLYPF